MTLMLPVMPTNWLMGALIFAVVLLMPTAVYFAGHSALRRFPKLCNALHWLFGAYLIYLIVAGLATLLIS
ncbi:hypothetical protein [Weissella fangxianensis]|uniref:hypothetical protein n=1 Tax=Weissella fangxianensis TaxID=2953879 RepID=UPI00215836ED|nr:hypothetical protein [Weissella fangxianensis]